MLFRNGLFTSESVSEGHPDKLADQISDAVPVLTFDQSVAAYKREDYRTAFTGFKKLAEQGHAIAQFGLGVMYTNGEGVPKDEQQAAAWYREAAEQGNAGAQFILGLAYDHGLGVFQDDQQAAAWYRKAAEQGNASAQNKLGNMYREGQGVPKDEQQPFNKHWENGHEKT